MSGEEWRDALEELREVLEIAHGQIDRAHELVIEMRHEREDSDGER